MLLDAGGVNTVYDSGGTNTLYGNGGIDTLVTSEGTNTYVASTSAGGSADIQGSGHVTLDFTPNLSSLSLDLRIRGQAQAVDYHDWTVKLATSLYVDNVIDGQGAFSLYGDSSGATLTACPTEGAGGGLDLYDNGGTNVLYGGAGQGRTSCTATPNYKATIPSTRRSAG